MFPSTSNSTCPAASPCTRLSRAPSTFSGPTSTVAFIFLRMVHSVDILGSLHPGQDGGGSPRCHDASISAHAVLLDPAGVAATIAVFGRGLLLSRYLVLWAAGCLAHGGQSLQLPYGLGVA